MAFLRKGFKLLPSETTAKQRERMEAKRKAEQEARKRAKETLGRWTDEAIYKEEDIKRLHKILIADKIGLQNCKINKFKVIGRIDRLLYGLLIGRPLTYEELTFMIKHNGLVVEEMRQIALYMPFIFGGVYQRNKLKVMFGNYDF